MQNLTVTQGTAAFRASWDEPGFRFHMMLNADGSIQKGILYKRPAAEIDLDDPAWFDMKKLKASRNAKIVAPVLAAITAGDLINRAIADTAARRKAALDLAKADPIEGYRYRLRAAADAVMKADRNAAMSLEYLSRSMSREALAAFGAAIQAAIE